MYLDKFDILITSVATYFKIDQQENRPRYIPTYIPE